MSVASNHFLSLVPHPFIDDSLIDSLKSAVTRKTVPQSVPASNLGPFTSFKRPAKMVVRFIDCQRTIFGPLFLTSTHL